MDKFHVGSKGVIYGSICGVYGGALGAFVASILISFLWPVVGWLFGIYDGSIFDNSLMLGVFVSLCLTSTIGIFLGALSGLFVGGVFGPIFLLIALPEKRLTIGGILGSVCGSFLVAILFLEGPSSIVDVLILSMFAVMGGFVGGVTGSRKFNQLAK